MWTFCKRKMPIVYIFALQPEQILEYKINNNLLPASYTHNQNQNYISKCSYSDRMFTIENNTLTVKTHNYLRCLIAWSGTRDHSLKVDVHVGIALRRRSYMTAAH